MKNSPTSWMKKGDSRKMVLAPVESEEVPPAPVGGAISDRMVYKARTSAKRASIIKLTARFESIESDGDVLSSSLPDDDEVTYEKPSALSSPSTGPELAQDLPEEEPLERQDSGKSGPNRFSVESVSSVGTISDVMIKNAKKAARRASLKKSIAELQLLKAGGSVDICDDAVMFNNPHAIGDDDAAVNSTLTAEERRQKFMMETILSESNINDTRSPAQSSSSLSAPPSLPASSSVNDLASESSNEPPAVPVETIPPEPSSSLTSSSSLSTPPPSSSLPPSSTDDTAAGSSSASSSSSAPPPPPPAPDIEHKDNVNIMDVIELIANGPPNLQERLETALSTIQSDKDTLRSLMKENFLLHHDVVHLDEQIKMLIKNRITVEEIAHKFSHLMPSVEDSDIVRATLDQEQQILYGQLFYELQHKPIYLVRAARCATGSKASAFTNTVLLSIFGDQYDNHEEHMLLVMLRDLLKTEFDNPSAEIGTFMRSNSCLTQMLSTYVRRPGSINAIKDMLAPILEEVIDCKGSFEVNPHKVYLEIINTHEQDTGEKSPLERNVSPEVEAANPDVQAAQTARLDTIKGYVNKIISALESSFGNILYGVRFLTKALNEIGKGRWPDSTQRQQGAVMGGFFFLRFITPIIVTPDGNNVTTKKIKKMQRTNLTLIAKVLQNLSNGVKFGAKEAFLKPLNPFLDEAWPRIDAIFESLIDVEEVETAMETDQFLLINTVELTQHKSLKISYNEIMQIHTLIKDNFKDIITKENTKDPIARIVFMLGSPKKEVPRSENSSFSLTLDPLALSSRNSQNGSVKHTRGPRLSVWDREVNARGRAVSRSHDLARIGLISRLSSSGSDAQKDHVRATKLMLSSVLAKLDLRGDDVEAMGGEEPTLARVLQHGAEKYRREHGGNEGMAIVLDINDVLTDMVSLRDSTVSEDGGEGKDPDGEILREVHDAYVLMNKAQVKVEKNGIRLKGALDAVQRQHDDLMEQIDTWKAYLENVKMQAMGGAAMKKKKETKSRGWGLGKKKEAKKDRVKFAFLELVKMNVVVRSEIPESAQSSVTFTFRSSPTVPGVFVVVATVRGFEAHRETIMLEDMLGELERGREEIQMDNVTLNVNMLVHMLNTNFGDA
ncbi:hypothetical protein TrRE_jg6808 [Triparma retinervis]|uniref:Ras-GAP domain-containing protein n=1 Tax=Triparma retinervis TaxID=2557542 RepID=A0A9W7AMW5_9STRA|nr:hypothetical protein TrRE_jg6808 [Triparma retinervis]